MKVSVDGGVFFEDCKVETWEEFIRTICQELLKKDLGVLNATVDGTKIPLFNTEQLSRHDIASVNEIEIEAQNIYETIKSILEEIQAILPETEHFHGEVTALINQGKEQEALKVLEVILRYWQNLVQVIKTVGEISTVKQLSLPNFEEISSEFNHLNEISQDLKDSIKSGDFTNIGDVVEQLLKPKIWVWKKLIDGLRDFINGYLPEDTR